MAFLRDGEKCGHGEAERIKWEVNKVLEKNLKNRRQLLDTSRNGKNFCLGLCDAGIRLQTSTVPGT